jgi:hypothetical protein
MLISTVPLEEGIVPLDAEITRGQRRQKWQSKVVETSEAVGKAKRMQGLLVVGGLQGHAGTRDVAHVKQDWFQKNYN